VSANPGQVDWERVATLFGSIRRNVENVIQGKPDVVKLVLVTLVAEGHLLIEDVPGVGKTMLAKAIARSIDCSFRRIQFTPDLLPTDVTGVNVFSQERGDFEFRPGAIFANIVLADEINRASPKTQSALLESMEERQVTVDTETYQLGTPFMVIATQNPIEHEGTYPLPEAQLDRVMLRLSIGYPTKGVEVEILATHTTGAPLAEIGAVTDAPGGAEMIHTTTQVDVPAVPGGRLRADRQAAGIAAAPALRHQSAARDPRDGHDRRREPIRQPDVLPARGGPIAASPRTPGEARGVRRAGPRGRARVV